MDRSQRIQFLTLGQRVLLPSRPALRLRKWMAGLVVLAWVLLIASHILFVSVRVDKTVISVNYGRIAWISNAPRLPPVLRDLEEPVRLSVAPGIRVGFDRWEQTGMRVLEVPLWPAVMLATFAFVFWSARQRIVRHGRCPKCGYDLAGLGGAERGAESAAPCPECGAAR